MVQKTIFRQNLTSQIAPIFREFVKSSSRENLFQ